ncbi:MAG: hypothetical protein GF398_02175 [Chitinivibrionales bacterium]|nr:hypothetical protein [Chitinivibrionales bacterium]
MHRFSPIYLVVLCLPALIWAQSARDSIHLRGNWFGGMQYSLDGENYFRVTQFSGKSQAVYDLLTKNRHSMTFARESQSQSRISGILTAVGAVSGLAAAIARHENPKAPAVLFSIPAISLPLALFFDVKSMQNLRAAAGIYNANLRPTPLP